MTRQSSQQRPRGLQNTAMGLLLRAASFVLAWWAFTESQFQDWYVGVVVILAATWSSLAILPLTYGSWSWRGVARFIPYFFSVSLQGGWDVARRALDPDMPLDTEIKRHRFRLRDELPRVFMAWTISLMPGTASVRLEGNDLHVHVLDRSLPFDKSMRDLERLIAGIFRESVG